MRGDKSLTKVFATNNEEKERNPPLSNLNFEALKSVTAAEKEDFYA